MKTPHFLRAAGFRRGGFFQSSDISLCLGGAIAVSASAGIYQWDAGITPGTPSGGTVTLASALTAGGLEFGKDGYVLTGTFNLTLNSQTTLTGGILAGSGLSGISISLPVLTVTAAGSGTLIPFTNTDIVNFNSTIVASSGSRQISLTNSDPLATTTITNFATANNASPDGTGSTTFDGSIQGKVALTHSDAVSSTTLTGLNSYSGDTTIGSSTATFTVSGTGGLAFYPTANGVSSWINGVAGATVNLNGGFHLRPDEHRDFKRQSLEHRGSRRSCRNLRRHLRRQRFHRSRQCVDQGGWHEHMDLLRIDRRARPGRHSGAFRHAARRSWRGRFASPSTRLNGGIPMHTFQVFPQKPQLIDAAQ